MTTTLKDFMGDFQDRGEPHRRRLGIDGTAADAQDVSHPHTPDVPYGTWCVVCGLSRSYRKHTEEAPR